MTGAVEVGPRQTTAVEAIAAFNIGTKARRARFRFRLREPAAIRLRLSGPSRRMVRRARLSAGRHSLMVRRLKPGRYLGVLTATDTDGDRSRERRRFTIG
jgi:hypothetical protein